MADTFRKKELQQRRAKRKQDKIERRHMKRENQEVRSEEEMVVYLDEFGNFTDVPPSEQKREKVKLEDIRLGAEKLPEQTEFRGTVSLFLTDKAYGFIREENTGESIFFHANNLTEPVSERARVAYEKERTPKGYAATRVRVIG